MPPRRRKATAPPANTVIAAAQILQAPGIDRSMKPTRSGTNNGWAREAWDMFEMLGEVRAASNWLGNAVSKCRLVATRVNQPGDDAGTQETGPAAQLVADFAGGPVGQSELLKRASIQIAVSGESYIIGRAGVQGAPDHWHTASSEEISHGRDGWRVDDGQDPYDLTEEDVLIRAWTPHPRRWAEADSPIRSSLPVLRELYALTMRVQAEIDSRLAGAGILLLPSEMTFPGAQGEPTNPGGDDFVSVLTDVMTTSIKDRESAAAVVPIVVTAPGEMLGNVQHITFWSPLDDKTKELREEAIRRWAIAADMPPEIITGMGDANHWGAGQIEQAAIEFHIEPLAAVITHALSIGWLRPALLAAGITDAENYSVEADATDLTVKADRSTDAKDLFDRLVIGADSLRREAGFTEADAPTDDETRRQVLVRLIDRAADPTAILEALGAALDQPLRVSTRRTPLGTAPEPVDPAAPATDPLIASADGCGSGVVCAAESAVLRSLEIAGKKLLTRDRRSKYQATPAHLLHTQIAVPADDLDRLLEGAWSTLAMVHGSDGLTAAVDDYVRDLLRSGTEHKREYLVAALNRVNIHG